MEVSKRVTLISWFGLNCLLAIFRIVSVKSPFAEDWLVLTAFELVFRGVVRPKKKITATRKTAVAIVINWGFFTFYKLEGEVTSKSL